MFFGNYKSLAVEFFDSINLFLFSHPDMLAQLELAFKIKYWLLLALAFYFVMLPYRQRRKDIKSQTEKSKKNRDSFLA